MPVAGARRASGVFLSIWTILDGTNVKTRSEKRKNANITH